MGKSLGLDFGANSIGWAIIDNNTVTEKGVYVLKDEAEMKNLFSKRIENYKTKLNDKIILSGFITVSLFIFTIINFENWQFWLNLGISGLLVNISLRKK